jgi:hypothetical protein
MTEVALIVTIYIKATVYIGDFAAVVPTQMKVSSPSCETKLEDMTCLWKWIIIEMFLSEFATIITDNSFENTSLALFYSCKRLTNVPDSLT